MSAGRRLLAAAAVAGLSVAADRRWRERQRRLALVPIGISKGAGITHKQARRDASVRARARIVGRS